jgi:hypothetical protein
MTIYVFSNLINDYPIGDYSKKLVGATLNFWDALQAFVVLQLTAFLGLYTKSCF